MFSNDNNIETIAQLVEALKHYIGLQSEYLKLDVIEKIVRLLTVITIITVLSVTLLISLVYFSFGSLILAFLVVGAFYLVLLIFFILLRHRLIERPLVRFLGSLLMSK